MNTDLLTSMSQDEALVLAAELRHHFSSWHDERAMIAHVSNKFRINKQASRPIVESYLNGFHEGVDSVFTSPEDATPPSDANAMFEAAFKLARIVTEEIIENQRGKLKREFLPIAILVIVLTGGIVWLLFS